MREETEDGRKDEWRRRIDETEEDEEVNEH